MRSFALTASTALVVVLSTLSEARAQRVQFPTPGGSPQPLVPVNPSVGAAPGLSTPGYATPSLPAPGYSAPSYSAPSSPAPGAMLGGTIQPFDPYALPNQAMQAAPGGAFAQPAWPGSPPAAPQLAPSFGAPGGADVAPSLPPFSGAPYGQPTETPGPGTASPYGPVPYFDPAEQPVSGPPYQRLFQDTGLRGTYLHGEDADALALTEVEASTTAYFANFLGIQNGLRVTPGFVFHWTSGPSFPISSDVPAQLYSAYLDFGIQPQFGPRFGAELNARIGVYSDFNTVVDDSIRLLGTGVGVFRVHDQLALKAGVTYIDRVDLKLLPAFGVLWEPNPQTHWDIFFPAPKISNYWTTIGNRQVWWYVGGEYGGGSWTIDREEDPLAGFSERIDINDIRIFAGLEWWNLNRYYAFMELGYVFDREIVYFLVPSDSLKVDDTFMVRGGVSW